MSSKRFPSAIATFILCAALAACGHKETGPPARYAFLNFENLSGDSSLDWVTRGASEYLARSLHNAFPDVGKQSGAALTTDAISRAAQTIGAHNAQVPGESSERTPAVIAGANHVVTGYVERAPGGVRIVASDENLLTNRTDRTLSATAASPFDALNQLARQFSDRAGAPLTASAEAFEDFATALNGPTANAVPLLQHAVALDPAFGRAWVALTRTAVASGNRALAEETLANADRQKLAPIDGAFLDFDRNALRGDKTATLAAMRKVFEFDPNDRLLARSLANDETTAGDFTNAIAVWKHLTANDPNDADAWNQLGYTLCWNGDYSGATTAIREYARIRPADPNPLDSLGDVDYWFGKYSGAAASYAAANTKSPGFLTGGDLYKEAWAKFRSGDKAGADAAFAKFKDFRTKAKDLTLPLFEGDWLYGTGRATEATALLRALLKDPATAPPLRAAIANQLAVRDLLTGDRAAAVQDLAASGTTSLTPGDILTRFIAQSSAPASEWDARAARLFANPELAGVRLSALGYALILDGKKQEAISIWEQIVKESSATDFLSRNILARLKGQPIAHEIVPDALNTNPFGAIPGKL